VQVWRVAFRIRVSQLRKGVEKSDGHAISALVIVARGVQRLVQVAYKVDEEAQSVRLFLGIDSWRTQDSELVSDGLCDATFRQWAELRNLPA